MRIGKPRLWGFFFVALATSSGELWAGPFEVSPVYIQLDRSNPREVVTIHNKGQGDLTVQVMGDRWAQDAEGRDYLEPTEDLVFFPRILKVPAGEERTVRLVLQVPPTGPGERTYRLHLRELPVSKPGTSILARVALQISLPVFVPPANAKGVPQILEAELKEGNLLLRIRNSGNIHILVKKILVTGLDQQDLEVFTREDAGWYVFPGVERLFAVEIEQRPCERCRRLKVVAEVQENRLERFVEVTAAQCAGRPAGEPSRQGSGSAQQ
jgi:fimbrial chaperone protein